MLDPNDLSVHSSTVQQAVGKKKINLIWIGACNYFSSSKKKKNVFIQNLRLKKELHLPQVHIILPFNETISFSPGSLATLEQVEMVKCQSEN